MKALKYLRKANNKTAEIQPMVVIKPMKGLTSLNFREVWVYHELLYFLALRDIQVRYKQTALGIVWAVLQPVLTMMVFTLLFGRLAKLPSEGIPYPIFIFTALLPWQLFAHSLTESSNSLVQNQQLVKKVYFPRLVIPLASVLASLVDFAVAFSVLILLMFYYHVIPLYTIITLPFFILLAILSAFAVGVWLSALNVKYRDIKHVIPFLTQFWMFATPIAYSSTLVPERWKLIYGLNPMTGVVEGFRWAILGKSQPPGILFAISIGVVLVLLVTGLYYFRQMESSFADMV